MTGYIVFVAITFAISFSLMIYFFRNLVWKLTTVATMFLLANLIYFSFDSMKGWPANIKLPEKGTLLWAIINEPREDDPGSIFLWVIYDEANNNWYDKYITYKPEGQSPRSFKLPYSKKTAQKVQQAQEALQNGFGVEFESGEELATAEDGVGSEGNQPNGNKGQDDDPIDNMAPRFMLIDPRESMGKGKQ